MYSGVSGMAAHMTKLNVIGNNIANANTYGFKSSRVVFTDVLYQNLSSSAAGGTETGGINASQLGYGAKVGSVDVNNSISSGADTGRALDVYINGEGYIPVKTNDGSVKYTRVGDLRFDTAGNLTDGSGSRVLGVPLDAEGKPILNTDGTIKIENLTAINIDPTELEKCTGIAIGPSGEITGIKSGDPAPAFNAKAVGIESGTVDKESNYTGDIKMTTTITGNNVKFTAETTTVNGITTYPSDISTAEDINLIGDLTMTKATANGVTSYTLKGKRQDGTETSIVGTESAGVVSFALQKVDGTAATTASLDVTVTSALANGSYKIGTVTADKMTVSATISDAGGTAHVVTGDWDGTATSLTLSGTDATETVTLAVKPDEFATIGVLDGVTVGTVKTDDAPVVLGYMAIAKFANPDGLSRDGAGYYSTGANSGDPIASLAGTNGTGSLKSSSLEMSNVDIAAEFTEMITAQRGFQANTRLITVSDSILEELINLKR
jgi:flagellar hook protein FlgE